MTKNLQSWFGILSDKLQAGALLLYWEKTLFSLFKVVKDLLLKEIFNVKYDLNLTGRHLARSHHSARDSNSQIFRVSKSFRRSRPKYRHFLQSELRVETRVDRLKWPVWETESDLRVLYQVFFDIEPYIWLEKVSSRKRARKNCSQTRTKWLRWRKKQK